MNAWARNTMSGGLVALSALLCASMLPAQETSSASSSVQTSSALQSAPPTPATATPSTPATAATPGAIEIDRVVAVVNGDLILESDVNEERRLSAFQPYSSPEAHFSRADAIKRLIDRTLILQQAGEQAETSVTDAELDASILELRKTILACKAYACETDAGWQKFLADHGFTEQEFRLRWRERMETLGFIEQRFRMGIRITSAEIDDYYQKTLLPEYASRKVAAPKLSTISDRIQEILLQQRVSELLDDWLKTLRASGDVRMMKPEEGTP
jgi:hypothetical protein